MSLNVKHFRRIELRKRYIVDALTAAEVVEYDTLSDELLTAFPADTVAYGRVREFIPFPVV